MKALLSVEPSVELREMFDHWWARQHDFLDVTAQLEHIRKREAESDYQSEFERDIETLRARRANLLHAAEEVRESAARDLDV